jgi:hypothetical protein
MRASFDVLCGVETSMLRFAVLAATCVIFEFPRSSSTPL